MLTYSFSDKDSESLYEHLYKCIKQDILCGKLAAHSKLPSKRSFAKNLGVSTITVENAYAQLMAEGYIYSLPKKGYYIAEINLPGSDAASPVLSGIPDFTENAPEVFADFTSNQTESDYFPFSIWSRLIRELLTDQQKDLMTNPPCGGSMYLRQAIADHLKAFHGMNISPAQVIIGAGTEYLYGMLIQLLGFDRKYAVEDPGYSKIAMIYRTHNIDCQYVQMDNAGILISDLEAQATNIVHISPSHHFPTGTTMTIGRRYELLEWASQAADRYIIEDDYDSEFRLAGQPVPTLQSIDHAGKVIYMNTFTKTLSSTVRIAYMVLPPWLLEEFYRKLSFYSCPVSTFEQYTLGRFIEKGYFEKHINRLRNHYHNKRDLLIRCIRDTMPSSDIVISKEDAGLHFLLKLKTDMSDSDFTVKALAYGIRILPLSRYYRNPPDDVRHIFIINYASITEDRIPETVKRLSMII